MHNYIEVETCSCGTGNSPVLARGRGINPSTRKDVFPVTDQVIYTSGVGTLWSQEIAGATSATYKGNKSCYTVVKLSAKGRVPFKVAALPASIDYQYVVHLVHSGDTVTYMVDYVHDGFPGHEFYISHEGVVVEKHTYVPPGTNWVGSPLRLLGIWAPQRSRITGQIKVDD